MIRAPLALAMLAAAACSNGGDPGRIARPAVDPQVEPEVAVEAPIQYPPDTLIEPWVEPWYPFLEGEDEGASISVGTVTNGHLINARALPLPGLTYEVLPRQRERDLGYGAEALIELIVGASKVYYAEHGARLHVGNIGQRGGGDLAWSVSHNSGRDADIAFAYVDQEGNPVDPDDLIPVDKKGESEWKGGHRFDPVRTWTVVKALLSDDRVQIQYLFISNALKKMLLAHARSKGEPAALIQRADALLGQPGMALAHNDHLHIRIHCGVEDVVRGCVNQGRALPGVKLFEAEREAEVARLVKLSGAAAEDEQRARAVERLVLLGASGRGEALVARLSDPSPRVRSAAVKALSALSVEGAGGALEARFKVEQDAAVRAAILDAVSLLGGDVAGRVLAAVLADPASASVEVGPLSEAIVVAYTLPPPADPRFPDKDLEDRRRPKPMQAVEVPRFTGQELPLEGRRMTLRLAAIEAAADSERPEPVPALVGLLGEPDALVRGRAERALRRLTNHTSKASFDDPSASAEDREAGAQEWTEWLKANGRKKRGDWLAAGFQARGFEVKRVDKRAIWALVEAIPSRDFLSYNAQRALMELSGHRPASLTWNKNAATRYWTRWFDRRRGSFGLRKLPKALQPYR